MVQCPHCARVVVEGRWIHAAVAAGGGDQLTTCPACLDRIVDHDSARLLVERALRRSRLQPAGTL